MNIKRISFASLVAAVLLSGLISLVVPLPETGNAAHYVGKKIVVYYFHGDFRCHTCMMIEALTKKAVNGGFKKELADLKIEIRIVNTDRTENEHFINDYNLRTKSVVISEYNGPKQVRWKNLPKIWEYCDRERVFVNYIQDEIKGYL